MIHSHAGRLSQQGKRGRLLSDEGKRTMSIRVLLVAVAGSFLLFAPFEGRAQGVKKMNTIDAHVHVWTPDLDHYPLAAVFKKENMQPPSFAPEELFKHCKPAGVTRINLIQMSFYGFDNTDRKSVV